MVKTMWESSEVGLAEIDPSSLSWKHPEFCYPYRKGNHAINVPHAFERKTFTSSLYAGSLVAREMKLVFKVHGSGPSSLSACHSVDDHLGNHS